MLFLLTAATVLFIGANDADALADGCLACHQQIAAKKVVHQALQMGCATCHSNLNAASIPHAVKDKMQKGLASKEPELCYGCHDRNLFSKRTVHKAVKQGCSSCHDPHAADNEKLLTAGKAGICYKCHKKNSFEGKKHIHSPVRTAECTACHDPHSSVPEKLLQSDMPDLCFRCHDKTKLTGEVTHEPAKIGLCTSCHNPHQSERKRLLTADIPKLCYQCHSSEPFTKKYIHAPVAAGSCLDCHSAHASRDSGLLPKKPMEVCLDCHGRLNKGLHLIAGTGHPVGPGDKKKPVKDPNKKEKDYYCGSCHNPHGSDWINLYRFEAEKPFDLCKYCHQK